MGERAGARARSGGGARAHSCIAVSGSGICCICWKPELMPAIRLVERSGRIESTACSARVFPAASHRVHSRSVFAPSEYVTTETRSSSSSEVMKVFVACFAMSSCDQPCETRSPSSFVTSAAAFMLPETSITKQYAPLVAPTRPSFVCGGVILSMVRSPSATSSMVVGVCSDFLRASAQVLRPLLAQSEPSEFASRGSRSRRCF